MLKILVSASLVLTACQGGSDAADPHEGAEMDAGQMAPDDSGASTVDGSASETEDASMAEDASMTEDASQPEPDADTEKELCKPGYYEGSWGGQWRWKEVADLGGGSTLTLPLSGQTAQLLPQTPGPSQVVSFLIGANSGSDVLAVSRGCLFAYSVIDVSSVGGPHSTNDLVGVFEGTLDCATGIFAGTLYGQAPSAIVPHPFTGSLAATYDAPSESFENASWSAREDAPTASTNPPLGGEGTWQAKWKSDSPGATTIAQQACLELLERLEHRTL